MYGQGPTWQTCRPAGFMSRKFTTAQQSYIVSEQENLAILEALLKWEDKLLGRRITIVTDHGSLTHLKTQPRLSNRQIRWVELMSRFDYTIQYVEGHLNKVADALSRYHEHDHWEEENTPPEDYVDADTRLDREGDDLPWVRLVELKDAAVAVRAMHDNNDSNDEAPINHRDYINEYDPTVLESRDRGEHLRKQMNHDDSFTEAIKIAIRTTHSLLR